MVRLETKALATFIDPPSLWKRYVDDTICKIKIAAVEAFLIHLNSQHRRLKFTTEVLKNNKIAFLEACIHVLRDRTTKVTIYRKATHTDQYLDFRSNHHIKQKVGIINTFRHRINTLVTKEEDKEREEEHVKNALRRCGHPKWTFKKRKRTVGKEKVERSGKVVIPYVKRLSENLAKIYKRYDIETIHKPTSTLRNLVCNKMKDKVHILDKTGAVYYNDCKKTTCPRSDYVGETDRVLRERQYEHRTIDHKTATTSASLKANQPTEVQPEPNTGTRRSTRKRKTHDYKALDTGADQQLTEGNTEFSAHVATDIHRKEELEYKLIYTEDNWFKRGVKEAIAIRKIKPTLNLDGGRHNLSAIYDEIISSKLSINIHGHGEETSQRGSNH